MIRDNQIESEWHPSVYAALDGIASVVGGIEDNDIGAAIAELVIKDLLQSMVTGVLICCPEHESRTTPLGENDGVNLMSKIVRILAPKMTEDTAEDLRQTMWKMFTGCVISKGQGKGENIPKIYMTPTFADQFSRLDYRTISFEADRMITL